MTSDEALSGAGGRGRPPRGSPPAAWVEVLQDGDLRAVDGQVDAAVVVLADEVEVARGRVAAEALPAEHIDDLIAAALADLRPRGARDQLEVLPVVVLGVEVRAALHHRLAREELDDRAHGVLAPGLRIAGEGGEAEAAPAAEEPKKKKKFSPLDALKDAVKDQLP